MTDAMGPAWDLSNEYTDVNDESMLEDFAELEKIFALALRSRFFRGQPISLYEY